MKNITPSFFAFAMIAFILPNFVLAQGGNSAQNETNKMNISSFNKYLPNAKVNTGYYTMVKNDGENCITLVDEKSRDKQHYEIINCFDASELASSNNGMSLVSRKAGVLEFQSNSEDAGTFRFKKNPDFVKFLKQEGIKQDNDLYYFKLFLGGIDEAFVLDIKKLGFQPAITELGRLVWHDTSVTYVEEMHNMLPELDLNDISIMSAHEVTINFLNELAQLGITEMDTHSIKKSVMIGLTPQYIKNLKRKGKNSTDLNYYVRLLKDK